MRLKNKILITYPLKKNRSESFLNMIINFHLMKVDYFTVDFLFFSWHPRVDSDDPTLICKKICESKIF